VSYLVRPSTLRPSPYSLFNNNNNNNNIIIIIIIIILTEIGLSPGGSGYFTCTPIGKKSN
jgi:hypothetical protein